MCMRLSCILSEVNMFETSSVVCAWDCCVCMCLRSTEIERGRHHTSVLAMSTIVTQATLQASFLGVMCRATQAEARNPLHISNFFGHRQATGTLLHAVPQVVLHAVDSRQFTPLHYGSMVSKEFVAAVLERYPEAARMIGMDGVIALHCAIRNGDPDSVRLLLDAFPDGVHCRDSASGQDAFEIAEEIGHVGILESLLRARSQPQSIPQGRAIKGIAGKKRQARKQPARHGMKAAACVVVSQASVRPSFSLSPGMVITEASIRLASPCSY